MGPSTQVRGGLLSTRSTGWGQACADSTRRRRMEHAFACYPQPRTLRGGETGLVRKSGSGIHSPWNRPWTTPESAQIPETSAASAALVAHGSARPPTSTTRCGREHASASSRLLSRSSTGRSARRGRRGAAAGVGSGRRARRRVLVGGSTRAVGVRSNSSSGRRPRPARAPSSSSSAISTSSSSAAGLRLGRGLARPPRRPPSPRAPPRAAARRPRGRPASSPRPSTSSKSVDRDRVAADPLDRVVEPDLAPVDADLARAPDLVGDVRRRDRAEERAGRAGLAPRSAARVLRERVRDLLRPARPTRASWRARCASRFSSSATFAGVAISASRRGSRKLRA